MDDTAFDYHYSKLGTEWSYDGTDFDVYTHTPNGQLVGIAKNHSGTWTERYPLQDQLGSITAQTNSSGAISSSYSYDPYGNRTTSSGGYDDVNGYAGGTQTLAGLVHFGQRIYDPAAGRWTQMDPLGPLSEDYTYAGDDPINGIDRGGETYQGSYGGVSYNTAEYYYLKYLRESGQTPAGVKYLEACLGYGAVGGGIDVARRIATDVLHTDPAGAILGCLSGVGIKVTSKLVGH